MLLECILESDCMKRPNATFKLIQFLIIIRYCLQDGIDKECKAIRYDHMLCRKSQVLIFILLLGLLD